MEHTVPRVVCQGRAGCCAGMTPRAEICYVSSLGQSWGSLYMHWHTNPAGRFLDQFLHLRLLLYVCCIALYCTAVS